VKATWISFALLAVDFYTTFVLKDLWNWFAVPALNVPTISYWRMYGLVLLIRTASALGPNIEQDRRWKTMFMYLEACVPEGILWEVRETIKVELGDIWTDIGIAVFAQVAGSTFVLALGWGVHGFLAQA
jgi:hypothetical protein